MIAAVAIIGSGGSALAAALSVLDGLRHGMFFLDANSVSPGTKREAAAAAAATTAAEPNSTGPRA